MKCSQCTKCIIAYDEGTHCCRDRCAEFATPRTKGKIITWAYDICNHKYPFSIERLGSVMVEKELLAKKKAPSWCPLNKIESEVKDNV